MGVSHRLVGGRVDRHVDVYSRIRGTTQRLDEAHLCHPLSLREQTEREHEVDTRRGDTGHNQRDDCVGAAAERDPKETQIHRQREQCETVIGEVDRRDAQKSNEPVATLGHRIEFDVVSVPGEQWTVDVDHSILGALDRISDGYNDGLLFQDGGGSATVGGNVNVTGDVSIAPTDIYLNGPVQAGGSITVEDNVLTIAGEYKSESDQENAHYHIRERGHGRVSRSFRLPETADGEKVAANLAHGILTLRVPTREEAKPRKIEVK